MSTKKKGSASGGKGKAKQDDVTDDWDIILEAEIKANQQLTAVTPPVEAVAASDVSLSDNN